MPAVAKSSIKECACMHVQACAIAHVGKHVFVSLTPLICILQNSVRYIHFFLSLKDYKANFYKNIFLLRGLVPNVFESATIYIAYGHLVL